MRADTRRRSDGAAAVCHSKSAATRNGVCESGELCMWQHPDLRGGRYDTLSTTANFNQWSFVAACTSDCSLHDNVSSLRNYDTQNAVRLFEHENYRGLYFWRQKANSGQSDEALNLTLDRDQNGDDWDDRFDSFCFVWAGQPQTRAVGQQTVAHPGQDPRQGP